MDKMVTVCIPAIIVSSLISVAIGIFLLLNPALAIELQKRFYAKINWRIEPISMQKELRNTKLMGLFLIIASLLATAYLFIKII